jgi:hypothetical protein
MKAREVIVQVSGITFNQFQQFLQELIRDLDEAPYAFVGQVSFQARPIVVVDTAGHGIFAGQEQPSNLSTL